MPQSLYRHFDKEGLLLYVGISLSATYRLSQHRDNAHWFKDIAKVTIEHFETREAAVSAEKLAISAENPKHNLYRPKIEEQKTGPEQSAEDIVKNIVDFNPVYSIEAAASKLGVGPQKLKSWINEGTNRIYCYINQKK